MRNSIAIGIICACAARAQDLSPAQLVKQIRIAVYELPELEKQPEMLRHLEAGLKQKFPLVDVVDASKLDEPALREKLQGPFLLIGTLNERSRLVALAAKPLPLRIDGSKVTWRGLEIPIREAGIRFIGKNPYGQGYCAVMAAGELSLLNALGQGNDGYVVLQGKTLVESGSYGADFVLPPPNRLSVRDAQADVAQFFSTLERVHPDLYAGLTAADYERLKRQTAADLAAFAKDDQVEIRDVAWVLTHAGARFRDGHTAVRWRVDPDVYRARDTRFPPFWLDAENGRFLIAAPTLPELVGTELTRLNGMHVEEFLRPVLDRCSGETRTYRATCLAESQPFWFWFSRVMGDSKTCTLEVRGRNGVQAEHTLDTLSLMEYRKLKPAGNPRQIGSATGGSTRVEFFDSGKIARLIYPAFRFADDEKKRIDEIFRRIQESHTEDLLIDLRGNGGGNSRMGEYIFRYFHEGLLDQDRGGRVRVSRELYDSMRQAGAWLPANADELFALYEGKTVAATELSRMTGETPPVLPKPKDFYAGRVWLLVSNYSFSSAVMFVDAFRDYRMGLIVGFETGGVPIHFGNAPTVRLRNSGIGFQVSTAHYFPAKPRPGDDSQGVMPDIPITEELLGPYRREPDPVLAYTLARMRGN